MPHLSCTTIGTGPALFLIHGFPLDRRIWTEAAHALASDFQVFTPDLPGFGESDPLAPMSMSSLASALHDFIQSQTNEQIFLGGLSMGGYVVQQYAGQFPKTIRGLLLVNTKSAADTGDAKRGRDEMAELVRTRGASAVADQMFPKMLTARTIHEKPEIADRVRMIMNHCPPATIAAACLAMRDRDDFTAQLGEYNCKTLVVTGRDDPIATPAIAEHMHASLRHGQLTIIPDAAHLSPLEQPQIFADAVRSCFL